MIVEWLLAQHATTPVANVQEPRVLLALFVIVQHIVLFHQILALAIMDIMMHHPILVQLVNIYVLLV
jgi:hypothetical protein